MAMKKNIIFICLLAFVAIGATKWNYYTTNDTPAVSATGSNYVTITISNAIWVASNAIVTTYLNGGKVTNINVLVAGGTTNQLQFSGILTNVISQ